MAGVWAWVDESRSHPDEAIGIRTRTPDIVRGDWSIPEAIAIRRRVP
jgi:hypothetical protein